MADGRTATEQGAGKGADRTVGITAPGRQFAAPAARTTKAAARHRSIRRRDARPSTAEHRAARASAGTTPGRAAQAEQGRRLAAGTRLHGRGAVFATCATVEHRPCRRSCPVKTGPQAVDSVTVRFEAGCTAPATARPARVVWRTCLSPGTSITPAISLWWYDGCIWWPLLHPGCAASTEALAFLRPRQLLQHEVSAHDVVVKHVRRWG